MPFNLRNFLLVTAGLSLLFAAFPCFGQGPQGMQLFGHADVSEFGVGPTLNEGYFFQFDGLYWSVSPPEVHEIGYPGTRTVYYGPHPTSPLDPLSDVRIQSNTLDTSLFESEFSAGCRFEFGRIEDRNGWLVSIFQLRDQTQDFRAPSADMVFNDPPFGPLGERLLYGNVNNDSSTTPPYSPPVFRDLPVTFYDVFVENAIDIWGVEANYLHRFRTWHGGSTFELFLGARYLEFNDNFRVHTAFDDGTHTIPSFLGGSYWDTAAENHVVGGQVGLRWFKKQGRWMLSTEGRFLAGLNCQNLSQQVSMGPALDPGPVPTDDGPYYPPFEPKTMGPTSATHVAYAREWAPAVELRVEARYQITRAISFHAGWTGFWMDGVARASSIIDYTVPALGFDLAHNREHIFINGVTIGFDVNR